MLPHPNTDSPRLDDHVVDEVRDRARAAIVEIVGAKVALKRSGREYVGRCPFHDDHGRPNFAVVPSKGFCTCFVCGETWDPIGFVMRSEGRTFVDAVRELGARVGVTVDGVSAPAAPPPPPRPRKPEPAPTYPPIGEPVALYSACTPVDVASVYEPGVWWLEKRRALPCGPIAALDLARFLPAVDAVAWPAWVPHQHRRAAWLDIYRVAIPVYDVAGTMRSLRFRAVDAVREPDPEGHGLRWRPLDADPKEASARGCSTKALTYADPMALALLRGDTADDGATWDGRVVICEGSPDFLTWATVARAQKWAEEQRAGTFTGSTWATFGTWSGAWTQALGDAIPDGATVIYRRHLDDNEAGDRIGAAVVATLKERQAEGRVRVLWRREEGNHG